MPVQIKQLLGILDLDSPEEALAPGAHRNARNILWRGTRDNMRAEDIPGTTKIPNSLLPATGVNKNIGTWYDPVNHLIISFNYNSGGIHGIYIYNTITAIWKTLVQSGTNTDGDILGFTLTQMITSVGIVYTEVTDGNLLMYIDTLGRPTCINIQRYLGLTPYTVIKRSFIDLAKAPFVMAPQVTYENDTTSTVNGLLNALYQFKARPIYDDYQKPVVSTGSVTALPINPFDQIHDSDPTQSCRISVYVPTGDADVKKIEIWGQSFTDGAGKSDYYLVATLNKAVLGIADNSVYRYLFKNDTVYLAGDINDTLRLQDYVPQKANALELPNGNVPLLGGITEGYDPVIPSISLALTQDPPGETINGLLFFASQGGYTSVGINDQLTIVLTGSGTNDVSGNPSILLGNFNNTKFVVHARNPAGTEIGFTFTAGIGNLLITATLNSLKALAIASGFVFISQGPNTLVMQFVGGFVLESSFNTTPTPVGANDVCYAYADNDTLQFGIQYYDNKGRTNGTSLPVVSSIKTLTDNTGLTTNTVQVLISSRPPLWAYYYDLVRSAEIGYAQRLFWVSNQTFTNVDLNTGLTYAYIGVGYMADYDLNIQAATPTVKYDFTAGDRIDFQVLYDHNKTPTTLASGLEYAIVSVEIDPFINGVMQRGRFIKIINPATGITFGGVDQQWFKGLIYGKKKNVQDSAKQTFFEFGKRFGIGNPGTANACHMGDRQSQTANLSQPAVTITQAGNYFYRTRNVPVGYINDITTDSIRYSDRYANVSLIINGGDVINAQFELRTVVFTSSNTNLQAYGSPNYLFFNKLLTPVTIRVQGEYATVAEQALTHQMMLKICTPTTQVYYFLVKNQALPLAVGQNVSYNFKFDQYINIPANSQVFIVSYNQSVTAVSTLNVGAFNYFRFAIINNISIPIIEASFSDNYNIVTNSNSRPSVFDENAKQIYYPTLMRWGFADQLNTNINQTNRFDFLNSDELDKSKGAIVRYKVRDRELRIFQERGCGRTGIYARFLQQNDGNPVISTTDEIISKNNVEYYVGEYGIGNQAASLTSAGFDDYFIDPVKGFALRLSPSGLDPISEQNKVQAWAGGLTKYLNNYTYQFGGNAQIIGCVWFCNDRPTETLFATQGGTGALGTITGETFSFREDGNAWQSFHDINPDNLLCAENQLYAFFNGDMYIVNNKTTYANFFGTQYKPSITLVFNDKIAIKKTFLALAYQSSGFWTSDTVGDVITSQPNPQTNLPQISNLVQSDYTIEEGNYYAAFMRDGNSLANQQLAICEGDYLKGVWIKIKMSYSGTGFVYMFAPYVTYANSSRNL